MTSNHTQHTPLPRALAPLGFLATSVVCQVIAFGAAVGVRRASEGGLDHIDPTMGAALLLLGQALLAWGIARWARVPPVWQLFNLFLVPGIASFTSLEVPGAVISLIVLGLVLLYLPTFWTRVPYYPTSRPTYGAVGALLPTDREFTLLDIGCGFAPLLRHLARSHPHGRFVGVEISPLAFIGAWLGSVFSRRVSIRFQSMWGLDFGRYDVVYAFLAPGPMPAVWEKVKKEMRPGAVFISNTFPAPEKASEAIPIPDKRRATIFVYRR